MRATAAGRCRGQAAIVSVALAAAAGSGSGSGSDSSSAPLHSNSLVPFCWPNVGAWDSIGDNLCVWAPHGETVSPTEVPPPKHALDSAGTRLPTIECGSSSTCEAELRLALRTDVAQTVGISFALAGAAGLRAGVPAQPGVIVSEPAAPGAMPSVRLEAGVSRTLRLNVSLPKPAPGSYSGSVVLHPANSSARCVTWGPWSCARPFVLRLAVGLPPPPPPPPQPTPGLHGPRWSWERIGDMAFAHTSNGSGVFSPSSTATLAKFARSAAEGMPSPLRKPFVVC